MSGRLCDAVRTRILSLYGWSPTCWRSTFTPGLAASYALAMSTKYGAYCGSANFVRIDRVPLFALGVARLACLPPDVPEFGAPQAAKARLAAMAAARTEPVRNTFFMTHPICRGGAEQG